MTALQIRDAVAPDAEAACVVMRRSIAELCAADHRDDPKILAQWLANKRPDIMRGWMTRAGNSVLVAIEGDSATLLSRQRSYRNRRAARQFRHPIRLPHAQGAEVDSSPRRREFREEFYDDASTPCAADRRRGGHDRHARHQPRAGRLAQGTDQDHRALPAGRLD
jgi:hypothetical protein